MLWYHTCYGTACVAVPAYQFGFDGALRSGPWALEAVCELSGLGALSSGSPISLLSQHPPKLKVKTVVLYGMPYSELSRFVPG